MRFSDNASVACEWKDVSTLAGYKAAIKAIEGLSADGGTNLDAGLQTANTQLSKTTVASISQRKERYRAYRRYAYILPRRERKC